MAKNTTKMLFLFALLLSLSFAGISVTSYNISQTTFKPGASGVISLIVSNPASTTGTTYRMTGVSVTVYSPPEVTLNVPSNIGDIEAGGSTILTMPFHVKDNAKSGIYVVDIHLAGYSSAPTTGGQDVYAKSVTVPVTIVNTPIFSLSSDKGVIGGIDPLVITLVNNGGPANSLRFSVGAGSPVALYNTNEIFAGNLAGLKTVNITLDARSAPDGPTDIPFVMSYEDEIGLPHSDTATMRLTIKNEVLDLRFNQLSPLITGKDGNLSLQVVNNGGALSDVRISFINSSVRLRDFNEIKVGDLAAGQSATVSALVFNDLTPGLNLVDSKISWTEKDIRKEQEINIPITIDSDADVGVYLEAKPSPLQAGQETTISVLVSNVGSYGIDNVDVGLSSPDFQPLDVTPRQYIGSLAKDDFSTVQFKVQPLSAGDYPIDVNVMYRDASGDWVNKTITQTATVSPPPSAENGMMYLVLGLIIVAAVGLWFFRFRKKAPAA